MDYNLAQKLKEAGFPLSECMEERCHMGGFDDYHFPTLSELIEACGEKFLNLTYNLSIEKNEVRRWSAEGATPYLGVTRMINDTPEEAVANLWLLLNKKYQLQ